MTIPLLLFKTYGLGQDDEVRYGEFVAGLQETEVFTIEYIDEAEPLQASDAIALLPQHFLSEHGESLEPSTRRRIIVLSTEKMLRMVFPDLEYAAEVQWQHSTYAPDAPATTTGFWGQQTIVALMDAVVAFAQGDTHCQFDTIAPQHGAEIIGAYCQVVYGLEWVATLRTAALSRTIAGQSYLTLVGIWESAQRHMRAAEGLEQPAVATLSGVLNQCAAALQQLLENPPTSMSKQVVERLNRRYNKEFLHTQTLDLLGYRDRR